MRREGNRRSSKFEVQSSKTSGYPALLPVACAFIILNSALLAPTGCVRRTMTIKTDPPNARVFLNDQEIGRSEVSTDFLWYGDYDVVIRKEGYETLKTHWQIDPPWYEHVPLDFFAEVLWPGQIHDQHKTHFSLHESQTPPVEEVVKRAEELREKVTEPGP